MKDLVLSTLQDVLSKQERINAEVLYGLIKDKEPLKNISLAEFRAELGKWNKDGVFRQIGIESARGRKGGFRKLSSKNNVSETEEVEEAGGEAEKLSSEEEKASAGTCINLSLKLRIYNTDAHNWALQTPVDIEKRIWKSLCYAPTLDQALALVARKILNKELQTNVSAVSVADLKNLAALIRQVEQNILDQLKEIVVSKKEENNGE